MNNIDDLTASNALNPQKKILKANWRLGLKVLVGFAIVFLAIWVGELFLGVGPNFVLRQLKASPDVRTYVGSTMSRIGGLVIVVLFSRFGLRQVLGLRLEETALQTHVHWKRNLVFGCLLVLIPMTIIFVIEMFQRWLIINAWSWQINAPDEFLRNVWVSLLSNLDAGVGEEVLFRGFLLTGLCNAFGRRTSLAMMAVIFAGFHLLVTGASDTHWLLFTILLSLPGVVLGVAYLRSGSLWLPIGIHFTWDLAYDLFNFTGDVHPGLFGAIAQQRGPAWFVGTSFGIEVGLAGILVAAVVWIGVWLLTRKINKTGFLKHDSSLF